MSDFYPTAHFVTTRLLITESSCEIRVHPLFPFLIGIRTAKLGTHVRSYCG